LSVSYLQQPKTLPLCGIKFKTDEKSIKKLSKIHAFLNDKERTAQCVRNAKKHMDQLRDVWKPINQIRIAPQPRHRHSSKTVNLL
jgi:hypothetical protein